MPIVLDLADVSRAEVSVQPSPLAELMAVVHMLAEPDHHVDRSREIASIKQSLTRELARELRDLAPFWARFRVRLMMPLQHTPASGLDHELSRVEKLPIEAFTAASAEAIYGARNAAIMALAGDEFGRQDFVDRCTEKSEARGSLAMQLLADPARLRRRLVTALRHADDLFFGKLWQQGSSQLLAAAADVEAMLARQPLHLVMQALNPGVRHFPTTQQVAFDKLQNAFVRAEHRRYVLVPSLFTRPHVLVKYDQTYGAGLTDLPVVIQFPVDQMGLMGQDGVEAIQHRLAILSDPSRLDILRHLVNEECTTTELARRTGMTAPQVSRHLRRLREAGLLESEREGRLVRNRLVLRAVYSMGYDLISAVVR